MYAFGGVSCLLSPVRLVKQNKVGLSSWVQTVWCPEPLRLNHFSALLFPEATFRTKSGVAAMQRLCCGEGGHNWETLFCP